MAITFKNENLNKPASEKQIEYLSDLLAAARAQYAKREPTGKGAAFLDALVLPKRAITSWEASSLIAALNSGDIVTWFAAEKKRRDAGQPVTSATICAATRSVFRPAYEVLFG